MEFSTCKVGICRQAFQKNRENFMEYLRCFTTGMRCKDCTGLAPCERPAGRFSPLSACRRVLTRGPVDGLTLAALEDRHVAVATRRPPTREAAGAFPANATIRQESTPSLVGRKISPAPSGPHASRTDFAAAEGGSETIALGHRGDGCEPRHRDCDVHDRKQPVENRGRPPSTWLRDGAARLLRANGKVGNPFVLRSPAGASRSTDDFFQRAD
jgi:hypothetical protein